MKLHTEIPLSKQEDNLIDYNSKILLLGSCFAENIGDKLSYYKFQNSSNPFGILFHPKAIETMVVNAVNQKKYSQEDVFCLNEQWHCFEAHSKLSQPTKSELIEVLNAKSQSTLKAITKATHVVLTLGTAWVYNHVEQQITVANCHKAPQKLFTKQLLTINEVFQSLQSTIKSIRDVNPEVSIILTVSPVRHLKDGFIENTQSKSHLISAIHRVVQDNNQVGYFPSYEIMMDELRDYRFYNEDMIHPNSTAVNYIWNKFLDVWSSSKVSETMKAVDTIQKGIRHRPFNEKATSHLQFLQQLKERKDILSSKFPHIVF